MTDVDVNTKAGSNWSEAQKIALLLSIYEHLSSHINWDEIDLPEGRTKIACQRVIGRMLAQKKEGGGAGPAQADKSGGASSKSPKIAASSGTKKAGKGAAIEVKGKESEATKSRKGRGKKRSGDDEMVKLSAAKKAKVESEGEDE